MNPRESILKIIEAMNAAIIGQETVVERLLIAFLADGHVLMEGLPGTAKTRSIKTLGKLVESEFSRVQFTPDLLPSDVTGSEIYREQTGSFDFQPGPIFGNLILADEINRAPAKVQAALLEAMEERQVTVAGKTHKLPQLFLVLATQNPIEQEGTYPLPEAQMDRFLLYVNVPYPPAENEAAILRLVRGEKAGGDAAPPPPITQDVIFAARKEVDAHPCRRGGRTLHRGPRHRHPRTAAARRGSREVDSPRRQPAGDDRARCRRPRACVAAADRTLFRRTTSAPSRRRVLLTAST